MKQHGFSLSEILVSLLIGSLALMATLQAQWRAELSQTGFKRQHLANEYLNNLSECWLAGLPAALTRPPMGMHKIDSTQGQTRQILIQWESIELGKVHRQSTPMRELRQKP